jgi:uncharacterized membrane protein YvlD (DUF360 family)
VINGFSIDGFGGAILVAAVFGVLHFVIGWFLKGVIAVGTLGIPYFLGLGFLVRWFVSAIVLKITDALMKSLTVRGFAPAFWAAGLLALLSLVKDALFHGASW